MGIEKIINRIIEDADKEADLILKQAEARYEEALKQAEEEAAAIRQEIIDRAKAQAEAVARRTASRSELERKKAMSAVQAQILADVYAGVQQEILNFPRDRLERLVAALIAASETKGDEQICFSEPLKKLATKTFVNKLNKMLGTSFTLGKEVPSDALIELKGSNYRLLVDIKTVLMEHRNLLEEKVLRIIGGSGA